MQPHEQCLEHEGEPRFGCEVHAEERRAEQQRAAEAAQERSERVKADALAAMRADVAARKGWAEVEL